MTKPNYLIIGQGNIGLPVTNQLAQLGLDVTGLARQQRDHYALEESTKFIQKDALNLTAQDLRPFTHIAIIVTPDTYDAQAYKKVYWGIAEHIATLSQDLPDLNRIVFISSTGVYGQDKGEWIDETVAPIEPSGEASSFILKAEQALQRAFNNRAIMIRPSGIYGKNRLMRIRKAQDDNKEPLPNYAWTNRIFDNDLVNIIVKVLTCEDSAQLKSIYLATDYLPVTSYELTYWLCQQMMAELPKIDNDSEITGKRLHSNIPRDWLTYPDWQAGYLEILNDL